MFVLVGWLCFMSHRQRGHLETAPPFTVPNAKEVKPIYIIHDCMLSSVQKNLVLYVILYKRKMWLSWIPSGVPTPTYQLAKYLHDQVFLCQLCISHEQKLNITLVYASDI